VLSNYAGNLALSTLLGPGKYLALHESDPTATAILATEVAGGGYARQPVTFAAPSSKTAVSTNAQVFPGLPVVVVTYIAVWDAAGGGHMIFALQLAVPEDTTLSGQFLAAVGDVALSL
jgi:hypothetical protein